jgi:hypothetical protein
MVENKYSYLETKSPKKGDLVLSMQKFETKVWQRRDYRGGIGNYFENHPLVYTLGIFREFVKCRDLIHADGSLLHPTPLNNLTNGSTEGFGRPMRLKGDLQLKFSFGRSIGKQTNYDIDQQYTGAEHENIKRRDEIGADFLPYVSQVPRTEVPYHSFAFGSVVANPLYWVVGKSIFEALEEDPFLKKVESYFKAMKEYSKR